MKKFLSKMLWGGANILVRPRYISEIRQRFNYDNKISLITSNCIGGEIYHNLGLKFTSPTINLWIPDNEFLRLASKPKFYFSQPLKFLSNLSEEKYPIAKIHDITIHFLHYKTEEEAAQKWYARCERINYDNLYYIMSDLDVSDDEITKYWNSIECVRKIMFTTFIKRENIEDVYRIKRYSVNSYVKKYAVNRWNGFRDFELFFDYVAWLNGQDVFWLE